MLKFSWFGPHSPPVKFSRAAYDRHTGNVRCMNRRVWSMNQRYTYKPAIISPQQCMKNTRVTSMNPSDALSRMFRVLLMCMRVYISVFHSLRKFSIGAYHICELVDLALLHSKQIFSAGILRRGFCRSHLTHWNFVVMSPDKFCDNRYPIRDITLY